MIEMIFWSKKGEYGPFAAQEDGWPNAGEVVRHYRRKQNMRANELAVLYGEAIEQQSSGASQQYVRNTLNAHYQLASDITRHQGKVTLAWFYANKAVKVTKVIGVNDFVAAALYRRGYISLEWGIFGENTARGVMNQEPDRKKIEAAIVDFEEALLDARPQLRGAIWLELSRAQGILKHTALALSLAHQAEDMIGTRHDITDPLEQILLDGALSGLNEGMYLIGKAASFIVVGRTTTAIEILDELEDLKNGKGITRNQTRRLAYMDTLRAEASLGTKDYVTAATRAMSALHTFQDIETIDRIAWINTIYERLVQKYGHHPEVKSLGRMLKEYYAHAANKKS